MKLSILKIRLITFGMGLLLICLLLSSCGDCSEKRRSDIWNEYRTKADRETKLFKEGKLSKEQLEARYYIWVAWRDNELKMHKCEKWSPSPNDRYQVHADQLDPICMLSLTNRYMELSSRVDSGIWARNSNNSGSRDSIDTMDEFNQIQKYLKWYGNYIGIGDVESYDAYGGLIPMDTALINSRTREMSYQFHLRHALPTKVELIEEQPCQQ